MSDLYRFLGSTGIKVSKFCMGTMTFGTKWTHVGTMSWPEADALVKQALEAGINFFDTADAYHSGESEEYLGKSLKAHRDTVVIATKVRGRWSPDPNQVGLSRRHIRWSVEQSLRRLGTDYIDLYQVHAWDAKTPLEETLSTLDDLVREGKVRYIGASNFTGWQLAKALGVSERRGWERFVTLQPLYNLMNRELENELLPLSRDQGLGVLVWSPLAGGFLSGKYRRGAERPKGARREDGEKAYLQFDEERGFKIVDELEKIGKAHGGTVAQAALNWVAAREGVSSVIIGARTPAQLGDNLKALQWDLTPEEIASLDALSEPPRLYPYWMIAQFHTNR
ncbi:MAG TPA: aldo/keto reductase [Candidatus Eisenbacteria bacterium]|nr:aldo/keto reductase [Candidatus Eisenbacteria bacterium]